MYLLFFLLSQKWAILLWWSSFYNKRKRNKKKCEISSDSVNHTTDYFLSNFAFRDHLSGVVVVAIEDQGLLGLAQRLAVARELGESVRQVGQVERAFVRFVFLNRASGQVEILEREEVLFGLEVNESLSVPFGRFLHEALLGNRALFARSLVFNV